jgi:hypothetical protein
MILLRMNLLEDVAEWTIAQLAPTAGSLRRVDRRPAVPKTAPFLLWITNGSPDSDVRDVKR